MTGQGSKRTASEHVAFRLDVDLAERIDEAMEEISEETGMSISRSKVIGMMIKRGLDNFEAEGI